MGFAGVAFRGGISVGGSGCSVGRCFAELFIEFDDSEDDEEWAYERECESENPGHD
jgi:hypothetical protein